MIENEKFIVIVANHDSFGVVPTLSVGSNDNGSGINAIIQLANTISNIRKKGNVSEKYGIIFLLTAGGYTNHEGTKRWLEQQEGGSFFVNKIELVICLNALATKSTNKDKSSPLYLHTTPEFEERKDLTNVFESTAQASNVQLLRLQRDIATETTNINSWHHEAFSRKDLLAVTLSGKKDSTPLNQGTSILDTKLSTKRVPHDRSKKKTKTKQ